MRLPPASSRFNWVKYLAWSIIFFPVLSCILFWVVHFVPAFLFAPDPHYAYLLVLSLWMLFLGVVYSLPGSLIGFALLLAWRVKTPHNLLSFLFCVIVATCLTWEPLKGFVYAICDFQNGDCRPYHTDTFSGSFEKMGFRLAFALPVAITVYVFRKRLKLNDLFGQ